MITCRIIAYWIYEQDCIMVLTVNTVSFILKMELNRECSNQSTSEYLFINPVVGIEDLQANHGLLLPRQIKLSSNHHLQ